jgi:hypothetical protein
MAYGKLPIHTAQPCEDLGNCAEVIELMAALKSLPTEARAGQALNLSAKLIEYAAFEMAGQVPSGLVGELINCAAELERKSIDSCTYACSPALTHKIQ